MRTHAAFLDDLRRAVAANLEGLREILPNHYRLTLLARTAMVADADLLVTQDTTEEIHAALGHLLAPPRPWHYVAEKLPEVGQRVRFWIGDGVTCIATCNGEYRPASTPDAPWFGFTTGTRISASRVYAWEPEPEPPPLPGVER